MGESVRAQEVSDALASAVESAGTAVVRVEGRRGAPSSGVAWSEDVIVTADHVVEAEEDIAIGLPEGGSARASVLGRDPGTDLAALRITGARVSGPQWMDSEGLKVGHLVLAVSRPGRTAQARFGVVAALGEAWRTPAGGRLDRYVQVDVALHRGFSGSALVDASGRVRGLNTAGLLRAAAMAVPAPTVRRVVEALVAHGHVRRGFLGVGTQPVRLPAALQQQLGQATALLVSSVQPGSPAEKAGVLLGDVLVSLDGHALTHPAELLPLLEEERISAQARANVLRAGELREVAIVIGARGAEGGGR